MLVYFYIWHIDMYYVFIIEIQMKFLLPSYHEWKVIEMIRMMFSSFFWPVRWNSDKRRRINNTHMWERRVPHCHDEKKLRSIITLKLASHRIPGQFDLICDVKCFLWIEKDGNILAMKLHRLATYSYREVKSKRDFLMHCSSYNWLYLSRVAALKGSFHYEV